MPGKASLKHHEEAQYNNNSEVYHLRLPSVVMQSKLPPTHPHSSFSASQKTSSQPCIHTAPNRFFVQPTSEHPTQKKHFHSYYISPNPHISTQPIRWCGGESPLLSPRSKTLKN